MATEEFKQQFNKNMETIAEGEGDRTAKDYAKPLIRCGCGEEVDNDDWIDELKMCKICYEDEYGHAWGSIDEAGYKMEDR